ncbi:uncharacterized protein LOC136025660 [Artemia franciscana]|uniref:uncharacterized protein LOC136025660 n=1 Tax=Artemia franciscana TaxID=6661 RepID=UPI0032DA6EE5
MYEETECCVKTLDGNTWCFKVMSGVRQGCVLSPLLFILVVDYIFRQINGHGILIAGKLLQDVNIADDVGLIEADKHKLQVFLKKAEEKAEQFRQHINPPKTKAMSVCSSPLEIQLGREGIKQVKEFEFYILVKSDKL